MTPFLFVAESIRIATTAGTVVCAGCYLAGRPVEITRGWGDGVAWLGARRVRLAEVRLLRVRVRVLPAGSGRHRRTRRGRAVTA